MFQQERDKAYFNLTAREWLQKYLPGRWIGR